MEKNTIIYRETNIILKNTVIYIFGHTTLCKSALSKSFLKGWARYRLEADNKVFWVLAYMPKSTEPSTSFCDLL